MMTTLRMSNALIRLSRHTNTPPSTYLLNLHHARCCSTAIQTSDSPSSILSWVRSNRTGTIRSLRNGSTSSSSISSIIAPRSPSTHRIKPKIRTHFVNILNGNYDDDDDDDELDHDFQYTRPFSHPEDPVDDEGRSIYSEEDDSHKLEQHKNILQHQKEYEKKRAKWENNAKHPIRVQQLDSHGRAYGRGGRKTASARVWIRPGNGIVTVNRREFLDYFPREYHRELILSPFAATRTCGLFDLMAAVEGGGLSGKAGAIRHGLARALEKYDPVEYRPALKRLGYLTRDARKVERKKVGLKKARKAPQWVRR